MRTKYLNLSLFGQFRQYRTKSLLAGDDPFPTKSWLQVTYPLLKAASFDTFCLVAPKPPEIEKEVRLHLTRTRHELPTSNQSRFYAAPNFLKIGIKYLNLSSFDNTDFSAIKDEKSAAKFRYIKTVCGKVVAQSIAFLSGNNILAGGSSVPLISEGKRTDPHWKHMRCTHHFAS